ncbi:hypothetical protein EXIGLDRAFT_378772 [Exidia glandulosa HHB12029]|uniref:Uncharacterized protein n=1 Tax=Exidia glandulosa HHB12029 TaxID=1314781 RepID=A0A165L524_EXIGL|nr:hypothetical protein EXIGLDRAFT_378772 [Exidia glandulosa HHB12029]
MSTNGNVLVKSRSFQQQSHHRHARTGSMPARPRAPTPAELIFCTDAEYTAHTNTTRERTTSSPSPAPATPTRLVKPRPFAGLKDSVALRREQRERPALGIYAGNYGGQNITSWPASFDDLYEDDVLSPSSASSSSSSSGARRVAPGRALVKLWKGLTGMRRKPVRDSVAFADFEWVTPRRA